MLAISEALADPSNALASFNGILVRAGYSETDIRSTFESIDDLIVAIAERKAFLTSQPLARRPSTVEDARDTLIAFGLAACKECSTTLVGFIRMMMAEGARNPPLKKRVYEAGPAIVTLKLQEFLSEADERGILAISDPQLYSEQLLGLLWEPLYQALMLNPGTIQERTVADRVRAGIERFVHGCATARSVNP
ncbi:TetR/AcrR family transcriptional regulator C-terminal domain-containing protein [Phyllobacterium salinisoli]|uniref:TetR/AcrR family transcriptional regulator C-terminal domain-containing protein n=1 Tax=Phyllobacterium salinisoli TaxID=1899321 RepID=UPI00247AAD3A|nr:TetR/AcrR family transcriptional regulator C-terminal domain-containing protein [Phyllobacterium salinisoli]